MAFTYDISTDIGQLRLEIGDTDQGSGCKPDNANFSDEELQVWLDREGSVIGAVAAACEALARIWARLADLAIGPRHESLSQVADRYAKQAQEIRQQYGSGVTFSAGVVRADGYSEASPADEYSR
ncbi:MAG: hypothetical protein ACOYYS_19760 [Chloroflexota bacterium]